MYSDVIDDQDGSPISTASFSEVCMCVYITANMHLLYTVQYV